MKKLLFTSALLILFIVSGFSFTGHISGTFGPLNSKFRIQYELPFKKHFSSGANINYYLLNWKGPIIEPFVRIYVSDGNKSGGFFQFKLGYGNLTTLPYMNSSSNRWSTVGFGLAWGYKHVRPSGFTIEPIIGVRIYKAPKEYTNINTLQGASNLGENIGWTVTTGFPLDFQLKFGYQF